MIYGHSRGRQGYSRRLVGAQQGHNRGIIGVEQGYIRGIGVWDLGNLDREGLRRALK